MNVYDFDNTIYKGESSLDFFIYCLKQNPKQLKFMPAVIFTLIKYKMCIITADELIKTGEKFALEFINNIKNIDTVTKDFWDKHQHKIKAFYLKNQKSDDCIISASPSFILNEIAKRLNVKHLICSEVDKETGKIIQLCFSDAKPKLFKQTCPDAFIDCFYTDSMNDKPMIDISKSAYLIKGNKLKKIK